MFSGRAVSCRRLGTQDLGAVAALHLLSWRVTYAEVLPKAYLGAPLEADVHARWAELAPDDLILGAFTQAEALHGISVLKLGRDLAYLDNFHVHPASQGTGMAAELFRFTQRCLAERDVPGLWLTALESNARARAFYKRMGGVEGPPMEDEMFGHKVQAVPIRWDRVQSPLPLKTET